MKRILVMGMFFAILLSFISLSGIQSEAVVIVENSITFRDTGTPNDTNEDVINGNAVSLNIKPPTNFKIYGDKHNKYNIYSNEFGQLDVADPGAGKEWAGTQFIISADGDSITPIGKAKGQYTFSAIFSGPITEATMVTESFTYINEAGDKIKDIRPRDDVKLDTPVSIITPSRIVVKKGASGATNFVVDGSVKPTGIFADRKDGDVILAAITTVGVTKTVKLTITAQTASGSTTALGITIVSAQNANLADDTVFDINIEPIGSNDFILNVYDAQDAVDDVATKIANGADTESFIDLDPVDKPLVYSQLSFSGKKSNLITRSKKFNSTMDVVWKWNPDPTFILFPNAMVWKNEDKPKALITLNPNRDDIIGSLTAKVSTTKNTWDSATGKLTKSELVYSNDTTGKLTNVTVRGIGSKPYVQLLRKITGTLEEKIINLPETDPDYVNQSMDINNMPKQMDVYKDQYKSGGFPSPQYPWSFNAMMGMGEKTAVATRVVIKTTNPDAVKVYVDNALTPYTFGNDIKNPDIKSAITIPLRFEAVQSTINKPSVQLSFEVYTSAGGKEVLYETWKSPTISVVDTTPSPDATLKSLTIDSDSLKGDPQYNDYVFDYGFKSDQMQYTVSVPNKAKKLQIIPTKNHEKAKNEIGLRINGAAQPTIQSGAEIEISFTDADIGVTKTVEFTVTAENGVVREVYSLALVRQPPSTDSSLKDLQAYRTIDKEKTNIVPEFRPDKLIYDIIVPYKTKEVTVVPTVTDVGAVYTISDGMDSVDNKSMNVQLKEYVPGGENITEVKVTVKAEADGILSNVFDLTNPDVKIPGAAPSIFATVDGNAYRSVYILNIKRADPGTDGSLSSLKSQYILTKDKVDLPFEGATFAPDKYTYYVTIPYSAKRLLFDATTTDINAESVTAQIKTVADLPIGSPITIMAEQAKQDKDVYKFDLTIAMVDQDGIPIPENMALNEKFKVELTGLPESGNTKDQSIYTIHVNREPPNKDNALASITMVDQDAKAVDTFVFNPETTDYTVEVPYVTESVVVTPKPKAITSIVKVNDVQIEGDRGEKMALTAGTPATVKISVQSEDITIPPRITTITIIRANPATDSRLKALTASGSKPLSPLFIASTLVYKTDTEEAANGKVTITATTVDPHATLKIKNKKATSGQASEEIELLMVDETISIEVTAQDGKSKTIYTIAFTNTSLIEKTDNADLKVLQIIEAEMNNEFKPAITEYEAAVSQERDSVDIVAETADKYATMKVFFGTKEIGDDQENFSQAIADGVNAFKIEVTSSDKKVVKNYTININKNEDGKEGSFKPTTPDMIDFESSDVITIDINKYPVISGETFNELKLYPEKTMILHGNDYTFEFKGSDITTTVPNQAQYNFKMSFSSPLENEIRTIMNSYSGNGNLRPVFVYFEHHGALPGKANLILNLGSKYASQEVYWHYYNQERKRIDYYGYAQTNTQGVFTTPITHCSTYISTDDIINGSEDRTGSLLETGSDKPKLDGDIAEDKPNPDTGEKR